MYTITTLEVYTVTALEVSCYQTFTGGDIYNPQYKAHVNSLYLNTRIELKERRDDTISFIVLTAISHAFSSLMLIGLPYVYEHMLL